MKENNQKLKEKRARGEFTQKFNEWLRLHENIIAGRQPLGSSAIYSDEAIIRRQLQRLAQLNYESYLILKAKALYNGDQEELESIGAKLNDFLLVDDGSLVVSNSFFKCQVAYFAKLWLLVLGQIFYSFFVSQFRRSLGPAALFGEIGGAIVGPDDSRFVEFVKNGPIEPLSKAKRVIVQSSRKRRATDPHRVEYSRWPTLLLLRQNRISTFAFCQLLRNHLFQFWVFVSLAFTDAEKALLARDYAFYSVLQHLNRNNLICAIFISDVNFDSQEMYLGELPNKTFKLHFLWHSQNIRGVLTTAEVRQWEFPHRRFMVMDYAWTWTDGLHPWLRSQGIRAEMITVGPIMFYLPSLKPVASKVSFNICLFDITPTNREWQKNYGWPYMYWNTDVCKHFLTDIISVATCLASEHAIEVEVVLKHKRQFSNIHDNDYIRFVEELSTNKLLKLVPSDENIFDLVSQSDFVCAIPFTSAALVARQYKKPAVFYDPTNEVWTADGLHVADVPLISGTSELKRHLSPLILQYKMESN